MPAMQRCATNLLWRQPERAAIMPLPAIVIFIADNSGARYYARESLSEASPC
jgi:hypothetical protein